MSEPFANVDNPYQPVIDVLVDALFEVLANGLKSQKKSLDGGEKQSAVSVSRARISAPDTTEKSP